MAEAAIAGTLLSGAGGATAGSTALSVAAGVAAAGQAVGSIMSARSAAAGIAAQQANKDLQIKATQVKSAIEEEQRQERLRRVLATQSALFAGRGVSGGGSITALGEDSLANAARESRQAATLRDVNIGTMRAESADLGKAKRTTLTQGFFSAGTSLLDFAGTTLKRGG